MRAFLVATLVVMATAMPTNIFQEYGKRYPNKATEPDDEYSGEGCYSQHDDEFESGPLNAVVDPSRCWPNGILHYTITAGDYTQAEIDKIHAGIDDLVKSTMVDGRTCVQVVPRVSETAYVAVYKGSGCSSSVGRTGTKQNLSLTSSCVNRHGTIIHEFLHAFGYRHEQCRTDRDDWITVNYDNIQEGKEHNFRKYDESEISLVGTSYDYGSVLHYSPYGFAIDPSIPTIITHDPDAMEIIGQRVKMSDIDIERVQILYGCKEPSQTRYFRHLKNEWALCA